MRLTLLIAAIIMAVSLSCGKPVELQDAAVAVESRPTLSDSIPPFTFPGWENAMVGVYIEDLVTGETVAEYGADLPFCPASIMKAVTCATVMSLYPDDQCFATRIAARGTVCDSVLHGDIVIRASGDPTLASAFFDRPTALRDSIFAAIRRAGIDSVTGSILIDPDAIPDCGYPPGWGDDDFMWPYGTMFHPFNWRDNSYTLELPSKNTMPHIPGLKVDFKRLRRGRMTYDAMPPLTTVKAHGRLPRRGASVRLAMPSPARAFTYAITRALADSGIGLGETVSDTLMPQSSDTILSEVLSPHFTEIMRSLMHRSDNLMAEGMMRTIAPRQPRDTAAHRELALWQLREADTDSVAIYDGSGLSRLNRVTPWFMADILAWMARSPKATEYVGLFPLAGREGTVKRFLAGTPLEGKLALKTGTMRGVRALAGYKLDDEGVPSHAVVIIVNSFSCSPREINSAAQEFFINFFS